MDYDVIVIGGGAAGLSAALMLARSRRSVLVLDSGSPRNAPAEGVHGFLGHDGVAPTGLLARGREELASYGGSVRNAEVQRVRRIEGGFDVDGVTGRRVLVATGLVDELPDVPGLRERWGKDVIHCPYCHGWEFRDRSIAVLASGPMATHQGLLFSQLSKDVTVLANGQHLSAEDRAKLDARGVEIVEGEVAGVLTDADAITGVRLDDGRVVGCEVITVSSFLQARSAVLEQLGLEPVDLEVAGHVIGSYIQADPTGRTAIDGVWAAGNVTSPMGQVVHVAAAGAMAGAAMNMDLIEEEISSR